MPEGDSLYQAARLLKPLVGETALGVAGSVRAMSEWGNRLSDRTIVEVRSHGKHLLVHFAGDLSLRTHLGMTGQWHLYVPGDRWRKTPGKARVIIESEEHTAVCFAAPDVSAGPTATIEAEIAHLGPDLLADEFDPVAAVRRAATSQADTAADLLLDQRVMAGVGNVYKSEVLFLERLDPQTLTSELGTQGIEALASRARRLLWVNRSRGVRNTTGYGRGANLWVYDRAGRPCRRCGTTIKREDLGEHGRSTFWCPRCQPSSRVDA